MIYSRKMDETYTLDMMVAIFRLLQYPYFHIRLSEIMNVKL